MKRNNLDEKRILIVDKDTNVLDFLAGETRKIGLNYQFEKAGYLSAGCGFYVLRQV